jgi:hypothetical protein
LSSALANADDATVRKIARVQIRGLRRRIGNADADELVRRFRSSARPSTGAAYGGDAVQERDQLGDVVWLAPVTQKASGIPSR